MRRNWIAAVCSLGFAVPGASIAAAAEQTAALPTTAASMPARAQITRASVTEQKLVIDGDGFGTATTPRVTLGRTPLEVLAFSPTRIEASVGPTPGTVVLRVESWLSNVQQPLLAEGVVEVPESRPHVADGAEARQMRRPLDWVTWPVVVGFLAIVLGVFYMRPLQHFLLAARWRVGSVSIAGVSLQFAETTPVSNLVGGRIDIRRAGQPQDISDSTLRTFYEEMKKSEPLECGVVDLEQGDSWLTSRLFFLCAVLRRTRRMRWVLFRGTTDGVADKVLGVADTERVRWRLAMAYPWLEHALVQAEAVVWTQDGEIAPGNKVLPGTEGTIVEDDYGRLAVVFGPGSTDAGIRAGEWLQGFLHQIQKDTQDVDWVKISALTAATAPTPATAQTPATGQAPTTGTWEHAEWLDGSKVVRLLGEALDRHTIRLDQLQGMPDGVRARLIVEQQSPLVPVVFADGRLDHLIDRRDFIDRTAALAVKE